jgi:hypothetical protein
MLSDSGLSDVVWAEALWHACYLQTITSSTGATTPWELLKGEKPDTAALRIWGCVARKLIPADKRKISADTRKIEKVRYVGIAWPNPKVHRVLTQRGVIEVSRHLAFDESAPSACDSRADFTPFLEREVSVPAPPPAPVIQPPAATTSPAPTSTQQLPELSPATDTDTDGEGVADTEYETATPAVNLNPLFDAPAHTPANHMETIWKCILLLQPLFLLLTYLQLHLVDLNVLTKVRSLKGMADMCQAYQGKKQPRLFLFVSRWLSSRAPSLQEAF